MILVPPSFKEIEVQDLIHLVAESLLLSFSEAGLPTKRGQGPDDADLPATIVPSDVKTVKAASRWADSLARDSETAALFDSPCSSIEARKPETDDGPLSPTDIPLPSSLSRFHSQSPPPISVLLYLQRIFKYTSTEASLFLLLLIYGERLAQATHNKFQLNALTVHRFLISCLTVATKMHCDTYFTNTIYAKIGGIPVQELNLLELDLLYLMDWRLNIEDEHDIQVMYTRLVNSHPGFQFPPSP